jgi:hypothetical protein
VAVSRPRAEPRSGARTLDRGTVARSMRTTQLDALRVSRSGEVRRLLVVMTARGEADLGVAYTLGPVATKVLLFVDNDRGYLEWLQHPHGLVINCERRPRASYLKLHPADCWTISGTPSRGRRWTTGDYLKACADDGAELRGWARKATGAEPTGCTFCAP